MYPSFQKIINSKLFLSTLVMLLACNYVWTQNQEFQHELEFQKEFKTPDQPVLKQSPEFKQFDETEIQLTQTNEPVDKFPKIDLQIAEVKDQKAKAFYKFLLKEEFRRSVEEPIESFEEVDSEFPAEFDDSKEPENIGKFHWKPAIVQSLYFLGIQHGFRMIQKKTHNELDGKFFADWGQSVRNLNGWRDGDSFRTNYIAHPMQGAVTGRIFINNSDNSKTLDFSNTKEYWQSRLKAMAWSAVWSTQFELGPISEASIGNVGLYDKIGQNRMGWVDLVVTPTAGTGVLIGEDMLDKFLLKNWLENTGSRTRIKIYRTFFTPFMSFTNLLAGKKPWHRDNR